MHLLPDEVRSKIPPLHSSQETAPDPTAYARVASPGGITWFVLELDGEDQDTFYAFMLWQDERFGYFSFDYLKEHLKVFAIDERLEMPSLKAILDIGEEIPGLGFDPLFIPKPLSEAVTFERALRGVQGVPITQHHRAYYYAARYQREAAARSAYTTIQEIIRRAAQKLSAYNYMLLGEIEQPWCVIVFGDRPPEYIHQQIMAALQHGRITTIPFEVLMGLVDRRGEETKKGEWREHHTNVVLRRKQKKPRRKRDPRRRGKH